MKRFIPVGVAVIVVLALGVVAVYWRQHESASVEDSPKPQDEVELATTLWVRYTAKSYVLAELIARDGGDGEVIQNIREYSDELNDSLEGETGNSIDAYQVLIDSEVIVESDGEFLVQTDVDKWERGSSGTYPTEVSTAMSIALEANEVDWCGEPVNGDSFAYDYYSLEDGHFESREAAIEEIQEFVECGGGEP